MAAVVVVRREGRDRHPAISLRSIGAPQSLAPIEWPRSDALVHLLLTYFKLMYPPSTFNSRTAHLLKSLAISGSICVSEIW